MLVELVFRVFELDAKGLTFREKESKSLALEDNPNVLRSIGWAIVANIFVL